MDLLPSDPAPAANTCVPSGLDPKLVEMCVQWSLRALVEMGAFQNVLPDTHCADPLVMEFVGVPLTSDEDYDAEAAIARLRARHREIASLALVVPASSPIVANIDWLSEQFGLSDADRRILLFRLLAQLCPQLREIVGMLGDMSRPRVHFFLSAILGIPLEVVRASFEPESALTRTGILTIDDTDDFTFVLKTDLIPGFARCATKVHRNPFELFRKSFVRAPRAELGLSHFSHLGAKIGHLRLYLSHAVTTGARGVNVLVYGPAGAGKTAFARALSMAVGAELFEVVLRDDDGEDVGSEGRVLRFGISQQVLAGRAKTLVLFDEIEDLPITSGRTSDRSEGHPVRSKGWLKQTLENNPIPTIWVTNDEECLDAAHLPLFDYHVKMDIPSATVRKAMLAGHVTPLGVSEDWCARMAENDALAPTVMARAAKVACAIRAAGAEDPPELLLEEMIEGALTVQEATFRRAPANARDLAYRIDSVNADYDLVHLLAGLRETGQARVCLYGPPGTGKSAFAAHVARALGRPPLLKRASDLLSPYLGMTEKRMAEAFEEAQREGAVLILDEADSFLRTREQAHHAWEVTAVNEMLTQMEAFEGIFFATTNLIAQLDAASLRRFDAKVCFDYLRPEQSRALMADAARALGIELAGAAVPNVHARLVPGDFANLLRQARLRPVRSVEDMAARLIDEAKHRAGSGGRAIGFLAAA